MRKALYLMSILEDRDIQWLVQHGSTKFVPAGTVLIREKEPIEHLILLLEGALAVTVGQRQVATLYSGELVGEISLVDSRPPLASVQATQDVRVLFIPRAQLSEKLQKDHRFGANFYRAIAVFLSDRLRMTTGRLGYGNASQDDAQADDELGDDLMDSVSLAAARFDSMLKHLS